MKIAILSFYCGHYQRGVERWTQELAKRLSQRHEIAVFQNAPLRNKVNYKAVVTGIRFNRKVKGEKLNLIRRAFLHYQGRKILVFTLRILPQLFKEKYDLIIPTDGGWEPAFVRILTWITSGKLAIVGHSGPGWDDKNNLWCLPDVFIALSKRAERWAERVHPFVKTTYIPNGVDLRHFCKEGEKAKINLQKPIFIVVGAPTEGKRIGLAIRAVSKLTKGSLLVLGEGSGRKETSKLGRKYLKGRFLMKKVDYDEISKYYRAADVFTLPSWEHEAFGLVYLEAMALGLPVVATDDELRREIVGDAGILVDPTDIDAYAKAIDKAIKTDWGEKPRRQAEKFSWDKIVAQYEKLFESLIK